MFTLGNFTTFSVGASFVWIIGLLELSYAFLVHKLHFLSLDFPPQLFSLVMHPQCILLFCLSWSALLLDTSFI